MVRKQVYIAREHEELLKRQAKDLGIAESELIRRGIEQIGRGRGAAPRDWRAWQAELNFIRRRAKVRAQGRGRQWTREELHDRRERGVRR